MVAQGMGARAEACGTGVALGSGVLVKRMNRRRIDSPAKRPPKGVVPSASAAATAEHEVELQYRWV